MATKTKRGWRPREETLVTAEFKRAHADALEYRKKKTCKRGHDLRKPEHVHAGTLLRTEGWWVRETKITACNSRRRP